MRSLNDKAFTAAFCCCSSRAWIMPCSFMAFSVSMVGLVNIVFSGDLSSVVIAGSTHVAVDRQFEIEGFGLAQVSAALEDRLDAAAVGAAESDRQGAGGL